MARLAKAQKSYWCSSKKAGWFKDTTRGDLWFKAISPAYKDADFVKTDLATKLNKLWAWAEHA